MFTNKIFLYSGSGRPNNCYFLARELNPRAIILRSATADEVDLDCGSPWGRTFLQHHQNNYNGMRLLQKHLNESTKTKSY